jgi:hypothetical protein
MFIKKIIVSKPNLREHISEQCILVFEERREMKITVTTGLPAKRDMNVQSLHKKAPPGGDGAVEIKSIELVGLCLVDKHRFVLILL